MHTKNREHIISKYCRGQLDTKEAAIIERWMAMHPDNKQKAQELLKLYRSYSSYSAMDELSYEKGYQKAMMQVNGIKRKRRLRLVSSIAASVIILLGSITALYWIVNDKQVSETPTLAQIMEPGDSKAVLTLGSGEKVDLHNAKDSLILIGEGHSITNENKVLNYQGLENAKAGMNTIRTPRGGEYNLVLADGTKVWLNADSELKYPVSFTEKERVIHLKGEAYLEVAQNPDQPFIVNTARGQVEVLGTSFNVKDYADEKTMETTLAEGKVKLTKTVNENDQVILSPSMQGVIDNSGEAISINKVDVSLYTSWKDGVFTFRNQSLGQLMHTLSRWYDFNYWFANESIKNLEFSGDIARYDNLDQLLTILEKTQEVKFEFNQGTLLIK